jgi:hypothetical protein
MRQRSYLFISILAVLATPFSASAHLPIYIHNTSKIIIPDADTSRAYYGELGGEPAEYSVTLSTTTKFYISILAPDIAGAFTDYEVVMRDASGRTALALLPGDSWQRWYEEFGGDMYLKGPEERKELPAGTYIISVDNKSHSGKYVLAPGEEEIFTVGGTPETIRQIYLMKTKFFGKPPYAIFEGIIGRAILGICIAILLIFIGAGYILARRSRRRSRGQAPFK